MTEQSALLIVLIAVSIGAGSRWVANRCQSLV